MSIKHRVTKLEKAMVVDQADGVLSRAGTARIEAALDCIYGDGPTPEPVPIGELTGVSRIVAEKIEAGLEKIYGAEACAKREALEKRQAKT